MTTLTNTVFFSKKALLALGALIASIVILIVLLRIIGFVRNSFLPSTELPQTVAFGKIPKIDFSEGVKPLGEMHYTVETISGDIPPLVSIAKVFKVAQPVSAFGNLQDALDKARGVGFSQAPTELSGGVVKFVDSQDSSRLLIIESIGQTVTLESEYVNDPEIFTTTLRSQEIPKNIAVGFFEGLKVPIETFPKDKIFLENYKVENGQLEKAIIIANSNLVKVIFTRADLDSLPVINPDFDNPLVYAIATDKKVVEASYLASNIQKFKFATYPLKGTAQAFEDLKLDKGSLNKTSVSNVFPIRSVALGYLETKKYQEFLQPIYIFMSDDGLMAYVAAVSDEWTN